jgi:hypothetical protein
MTTTAGDGAGNLRGCADARVRPNYGVLNSRAFFNETTLAQDRVDNLSARLDLAVVSND